jgi:uncharacterized protein (DUF924 family)
MAEANDWRSVIDFWFPPGLDDADADIHRRMFGRWFAGGANAEMARFEAVLAAARAGRLDHWRAAPLARLALIVVLDQFPRGLLAGTPAAYASDPDALRIALEGLDNGHYDALTRPWEKRFFFMPLCQPRAPTTWRGSSGSWRSPTRSRRRCRSGCGRSMRSPRARRAAIATSSPVSAGSPTATRSSAAPRRRRRRRTWPRARSSTSAGRRAERQRVRCMTKNT